MSREELRSLFLFEALSDAQLDGLLVRGEFRTYAAGTVLAREGDPAEFLFVLVDGEVLLSRLSVGEDVPVVRTSHRGAYAGAVRAYVQADEPYTGTTTTTAPSRLFRVPAADFADLVRREFPMAQHLLEGLYIGIRSTEAQVRQREHLANLGVLSANLAHELNNPAAATVRASAQLRSRVAAMRAQLGTVASGGGDPRTVAVLVELQERTVAQVAAHGPSTLSPLQTADAEDELDDALSALGVVGVQDLAPVLVAAGLDAAWVQQVADAVAPSSPEQALRWMTSTLEAEALLDDVEEASSRISALVGAVKDYAHVDRASRSEVDLHSGLDSTVVMLGTRLSRLEVVREYDRSLPRVDVWPGELNQVWTNLLDNAAYAARSRVVLRTRQQDGEVVVEIGDDGPGIPEDVLPRVFEAFFTTKPPGQGSGLGLDSAKRIVELRHHGRMALRTSAQGTTVEVRLPLRSPEGA